MLLTNKAKAIKPLKYGILIVCEDTNSNYRYIEDKVNACQPKSNATQIVDFKFGNSADAGGTQTNKLVDYAIKKLSNSILITIISIYKYFKKMKR